MVLTPKPRPRYLRSHSHPQAFEEGGDLAGVATLMGFLASLLVKLSMEGTHEAHGTVMEAACPTPLLHPLP